jgi:hypothetical protein
MEMRGARSEATAAAPSTASTAREAAAWEPAAARLLEQWTHTCGGSGFGAGIDVRHEFGSNFDISLDQFGGLTVADAESQTNRLELLIGEHPHAADAFDWRQWTE